MSRVQNFNTTPDQPENDYTVKLFKNNTFVESLNFDATKKQYISATSASLNTNYRIEIEDNTGEKLTASDSIGSQVSVTSAVYYKNAYYDSNEGRNFDEGVIEFTDSPGQDYYELSVFSTDTSFSTYNNNTQIFTYYLQYYPTQFLTSQDPVILAENYLDLNKFPHTLVFSDNLLRQTNKIRFLFINREQDNGNYLDYVVLRNVSYDYYMFRKTWIAHEKGTVPFQFDNITDLSKMIFMSEPVEAYTNVTGGMGIFAGYTEDVKEMTLIAK
jgi:hypothetical protein